jgi:DNA polymerase-3 subunit epsilon
VKHQAILVSAITVLGAAAGAAAGQLWHLPLIPLAVLGIAALGVVTGVGWMRLKGGGGSGDDEATTLLARAAKHGQRQEELWRAFTQELRGRLANIRAAAETMETFPHLESVPRRQLQETIVEESKALSESLEAASKQIEEARESSWQLERITGRDLALRIASHLEDELGVRCSTDLIDAPMWVRAESRALVEALGDFITQLKEEFGIGIVRLRLREEDGFATLDLIWGFNGVDVEALYAWQDVVMTPQEGEPAPRLKVVARMHGGESWFNLDRNAANAYLRILVPVTYTATS